MENEMDVVKAERDEARRALSAAIRERDFLRRELADAIAAREHAITDKQEPMTRALLESARSIRSVSWDDFTRSIESEPEAGEPMPWEDFMRTLEADAEAEGPEAVAQLDALRAYYQAEREKKDKP